MIINIGHIRVLCIAGCFMLHRDENPSYLQTSIRFPNIKQLYKWLRVQGRPYVSGNTAVLNIIFTDNNNNVVRRGFTMTIVNSGE